MQHNGPMETTYLSSLPLETSGKVTVGVSQPSKLWSESLMTKMPMTFTQEKGAQVPNKLFDYDVNFLENMSLRLILTYPYSASFVFAFFFSFFWPFDFILSISTSSAKSCKKIIQDDRQGNILTSLWFSSPEPFS